MQIEYQCPQCGGPVILEETDRLLQCAFCKSNLYIWSKDHLRYYFPSSRNYTEETIFVPYWRFRGMHFQCKTSGIQGSILDRTSPAIESGTLPATLGIRPQSLKVKLVETIDNARFLEPRVPFDESCVETTNLVTYDRVTTNETRLVILDGGTSFKEVPVTRTELKEDRLYHEAFIAETVSTIYTPVFVRNGGIYDGITEERLGTVDDEGLSNGQREIDWTPQFLATLCPNCGWDLIAERDSCILLCSHCNTAWKAWDNSLQQTPYTVVDTGNTAQKTVYLPFWKIKVDVSGISLHSYADFVRLANLPKAIRTEWETPDVFFRIPAFKVAPAVFLRIARQMTLSPLQGELREDFRRDTTIYPVSVALPEALQILKTALVDISIKKKMTMETLGDITINPLETLLVFSPFEDTNYELIDDEVKCSVMKSALRWGKNI